MTERHDIRGRRVLLWVGLVGLLIAALTVPDEWLAPIESLLGESEDTSAFTDDVAALDEELQEGAASLTPDQARVLVPHVAARRLVRAGPLTVEDTEDAARIWRRAMRAAADEPEDGSPQAHYEAAQERIIEAFPRLDPRRVSKELQLLREQVDSAMTRAPGSAPSAEGNMECGTCHGSTRPLPDGREFDVTGIYPFMADADEFDEGRRIPVLVESLELSARMKRMGDDEALGDAECLTCHVPHGADGFEIRHGDRIENMGLWVNTFGSSPRVFHLEVKVQNSDSGHRAPAGLPRAAYVTTVQAFQGDRPLTPRFGERLPKHLRTDEYEFGTVFARHMVDKDGNITTRLEEVVDLVFDSRLAAGRFEGEHYVFDRRDDSRARVVVTLWYLPDYSTWKGAKAIRRADKPER